MGLKDFGEDCVAVGLLASEFEFCLVVVVLVFFMFEVFEEEKKRCCLFLSLYIFLFMVFIVS